MKAAKFDQPGVPLLLSCRVAAVVVMRGLEESCGNTKNAEGMEILIVGLLPLVIETGETIA